MSKSEEMADMARGVREQRVSANRGIAERRAKMGARRRAASHFFLIVSTAVRVYFRATRRSSTEKGTAVEQNAKWRRRPQGNAELRIAGALAETTATAAAQNNGARSQPKKKGPEKSQALEGAKKEELAHEAMGAATGRPTATPEAAKGQATSHRAEGTGTAGDEEQQKPPLGAARKRDVMHG